MTRESLSPATEWETDEIRYWRANYMACAYNAAVNYGYGVSFGQGSIKELARLNGRGHRKMHDLIRAINQYNRVEGRAKLQRLVDLRVIEGFQPCPPECGMRPGGLFHAKGCENEGNHPVYRSRQQRAREVLPGGPSGDAGWWAANVALVGADKNG